MQRLILGLLVIVMPILAPWWLVLPVWMGYGFLYRGYELIAIGLLMDCVVGYGENIPLLYTLMAIGACVTMSMLRTRVALNDY